MIIRCLMSREQYQGLFREGGRSKLGESSGRETTLYCFEVQCKTTADCDKRQLASADVFRRQLSYTKLRLIYEILSILREDR
jgi:hypothetical protein